jgi:phosphoserine aminotransferase
MLDWQGSGMSVMEMSHRGREFMSIADEAQRLLRELLAVPANYKVLFMQGGAIAENAIVPAEHDARPGQCDYIDTGEWSKKSHQGSVEVRPRQRRRQLGATTTRRCRPG